VQLAAVGPTLPEVLAAARLLERDGVSAHVVDVTCPDAVYAAWQRGVQHALRASATPPVVGVLRQAFDLTAPLVAVHDRSGESLTWLGSALGLALVPVSITCRPDEHTEEMVVSAALAALSL
jgi:pyruvate dehydrogenase complex dehydrogenase (E1) component